MGILIELANLGIYFIKIDEPTCLKFFTPNSQFSSFNVTLFLSISMSLLSSSSFINFSFSSTSSNSPVYSLNTSFINFLHRLGSIVVCNRCLYSFLSLSYIINYAILYCSSAVKPRSAPSRVPICGDQKKIV